jgi:hypothetical protein
MRESLPMLFRGAPRQGLVRAAVLAALAVAAVACGGGTGAAPPMCPTG